jgi:hypothetical protein
MRTERSLGRSLVVALSVMLLAGCASAPPTPVRNIDRLVGKWSGTATVGGDEILFYLTIYPDQKFHARYGITESYGTITIANGQMSYQMSPPISEGSIRYFRGPGKPSLYMDDLWDTFHAVVTREP